MRILKKIQTRFLVLCMALLLTLAFAVTGIPFEKLSANASKEETGIIYIDTEVEGIVFTQHPNNVFFGFRLTESDYDDFNNWEGDFANNPEAYLRYADYLCMQLTYWENFPKMNSEGVILDQLYAYWSGGLNPLTNTHALPAATYKNTVAHRSTLALLEYGFTISFPAGTTFPCAEYVKNGCQGTPVAYRTTEDKAFYYDGSSFVVLPYAISQQRSSAIDEINSINYRLYYQEEADSVRALVEEANATLKGSFTSFAIQDVLSAFYTELNKIMTIADYEELALKKETGKIELSAFFSGLSQDAYDAADWDKILSMQKDYTAMLDALATSEEVDAAVAGVKFAVDKVLTKTEKTDFAAYQTAASEEVENAFVASLYREQESAQGAALVEEAKTLIAQATTHDEVDGVALTYIARIGELKTAAQWEAEEENKTDDSTDNSTEQGDSSEEETASKSKGCNGYVNEMGIMFGVAVIAMLMVTNKKRTGNRNEK